MISTKKTITCDHNHMLHEYFFNPKIAIAVDHIGATVVGIPSSKDIYNEKMVYQKFNGKRLLWIKINIIVTLKKTIKKNIQYIEVHKNFYDVWIWKR